MENWCTKQIGVTNVYEEEEMESGVPFEATINKLRRTRHSLKDSGNI